MNPCCSSVVAPTLACPLLVVDWVLLAALDCGTLCRTEFESGVVLGTEACGCNAAAGVGTGAAAAGAGAGAGADAGADVGADAGSDSTRARAGGGVSSSTTSGGTVSCGRGGNDGGFWGDTSE